MKISKPKTIIFVPCLLAVMALATLTLVHISQNQTGTDALENFPVRIAGNYTDADLPTTGSVDSFLARNISLEETITEEFARLPDYKSTNLVDVKPQSDTHTIQSMFRQTAPGSSEAYKLTLQAWIPELFGINQESSEHRWQDIDVYDYSEGLLGLPTQRAHIRYFFH